MSIKTNLNSSQVKNELNLALRLKSVSGFLWKLGYNLKFSFLGFLCKIEF